jgi:nucleoid-associated protein EbfC
MGSGFLKKKKQNKMLFDQINKMQEQMQSLEIIGTAGNGLVTLTMTGEGDLKQVKIKPECVDKDDIEGLETLVKAAFDDASRQIKEATPQTPDLSSFFQQ